MKKILTPNEFFNTLNESIIPKNEYFKKDELLKSILLKNQDFSKGEISYAFSDILYDKWQSDNKLSYENVLNYMDEFGKIPLFSCYFNIYNGQVCNGGHSQYFENGYASSHSSGAFGNYKDTDKHDDFVELFKELELDKKLPHGKEAYNVISKFDYDVDEMTDCDECDGDGTVECYICKGDGYIDCPECNGDGEDEEGEECSNCDGRGNIECKDCDGGRETCNKCNGSGEIENEGYPEIWETLDDRWYEINDELKKELDEYIKTLEINNEKIDHLIKISKNIQKFNI